VTELEELFGAWVHQAYHRAVHSETGQAPAPRFAAPGSRLRQIAPQLIDEAFLWQDFRTVTKTATISLHGNRYQTDPALAGRKVEVLLPARLPGGPGGFAMPSPAPDSHKRLARPPARHHR
jgi:putative transposase